jgi:hypothetical protein
MRFCNRCWTTESLLATAAETHFRLFMITSTCVPLKDNDFVFLAVALLSDPPEMIVLARGGGGGHVKPSRPLGVVGRGRSIHVKKLAVNLPSGGELSLDLNFKLCLQSTH